VVARRHADRVRDVCRIQRGQVNLFTVAPDGSQLTQVTDSPEVEYVPSLGHPPAYCVAHTGLRPVARFSRRRPEGYQFG
jgi:hypothetical protein